ncbi:MAG: response regulator [Elusimicrobia bacterium]|nr:response regulator [Elusimicrobiota bacterium]
MADRQINKKVLIVDDDQDMLHVWDRMLRREDIDGTFCAGGQGALDLLTRQDFAAVFTDFQMPGINGAGVLEFVKKKSPATCVSIVTGLATLEGAVSCVKNGACDYIAKPCEAAELIVKVKRCLLHHQERVEMGELRQSVRRYEELDELKSQFVSNVSYELRTPLFSIRAAFDLLSTELANGDPVKARLSKVISGNIDRLARLIGNLLDYSRIEKGVLSFVFEDVDLAAVVRQVAQALEFLIQARGISLLAFESSPLSITGDLSQLTQLVTNLLANAIKFTHPGGKVGIELKDLGEDVEMVIWDTGIGIAGENREKIFERFYQVDGSLTREAGGTDIGLTIVRAIVENHGGTIELHSELGKGSRFQVRLPKKPKAAAQGGSHA